MSAVLLGGIGFFHNIVQEDVLREHKKLIDELREEIEKIENFDETAILGNNQLRIHVKCFAI